MRKITKNYKPLTQTFYEEFAIPILNELVKEIKNRIESTGSFSSINDGLVRRSYELSEEMKENNKLISFDDEFLKDLLQELEEFMSKSIIDEFCKEWRNMSSSINNDFCEYYKRLASELEKLLSPEEYSKLDGFLNKFTELMMKSALNDLNKMQEFLSKKFISMKRFREFSEKICDYIDGKLYYTVSTFILFFKLINYIIVSVKEDEGKDKQYKILKLNGSWIDKENRISLHKCFYKILNEIDIPAKDKDVRKILLDILKCDKLLNDILSEENIDEYYRRKTRKSLEEGKSFLLDILCRHLGCKNEHIFSKILDAYFIPTLLRIEKDKLIDKERLKLLERLIKEKSILELEVFGYLSKLGFPSAMNIEIYEVYEEKYDDKIKRVVKRDGEIDVIALGKNSSRITLYLIEVTTERDLNQKIEELKTKIGILSYLLPFNCKGILVHAEDRTREEKDGIFLIPFTTYDEELQKYLSKNI